MKNLFPLLLLALLAVSCKKENPTGPTPVTPTPNPLTGNYCIFNGDTHTYDTIIYGGTFGAWYIDSMPSTGTPGMAIGNYGDTINYSLVMEMPAAATGTYQATGNLGTHFLFGQYGYGNAEITVNITRCDTVGGLVEGNYSGVAINSNNDSISVNGAFSNTRYPDY